MKLITRQITLSICVLILALVLRWLVTLETPDMGITTLPFQGLRILSIIAMTYLLIGIVLCSIGRLFSNASLQTLTPLTIRRLTAWAIPIGLAGNLATATPVSATSSAVKEPIPIMRLLSTSELPHNTTTTTTITTALPTSILDSLGTETPSQELIEQSQLPGTSESSEHVVSPGENFWSIAEVHLLHNLNARPSEQQLTNYWLEMVDLNRDRLRNPDNPDLLIPGQKVLLPPT